MPILHLLMQGQTTSPSGQVVSVPAADALLHRGPVVQVSLTVSQTVAQQLMAQGQAVPPPVTGVALIDTGASMTCVDEAAAQQVGAPIIDVVRMHSASHAGVNTNVYPIRFEVTALPVAMECPRALAANLQSQGLLLLIGRDMLRMCTLHYNGISGEFTLAL